VRGVVAGLVIGFACALLAMSCAHTEGSPWEQRYTKMNEITTLWSQIRDWRHEAHMTLDPTPQDLLQWGTRPAREAKGVCPANHEVPTTCGDVCNLGDDICDNAERICTIADELGKDDHDAQDKCSSAKASCREAKQRCCDCAGPAGTVP
jgi:hypothetical protein